MAILPIVRLAILGHNRIIDRIHRFVAKGNLYAEYRYPNRGRATENSRGAFRVAIHLRDRLLGHA